MADGVGEQNNQAMESLAYFCLQRHIATYRMLMSPFPFSLIEIVSPQM
jgi:hypothetical protein